MSSVAKYLFAAALTCAGAHAADLQVSVADVSSAKGTLRIAVVDSAAAWDDKAKPVAGATRKANGAAETFRFPNLPAGSYAVRVMHDENDNGKLDVNFAGLPTEGYGFSNDPKVMRKPTFDEAKFELGADGGAITVRLR